MAHLEHAGGSFGPPFDPFGEPATAATRWKVWMRNFQYYVDGQIGLGDKQKIARLLHQAGPEVQEIYDTIQNEAAEGSEYEKCVKRLNSYFEPILNTAYERQKFRNLEMQTEETCAQFILRLRAQARYCSFTNVEEALRDQVIEKCTDMGLKRKLIKKGSDLTIGKVIEISQLYEIEKNMFGKKKEDQNQDRGLSVQTR